MFIARNPEFYLGTSVGNGHCVAYVRAVSDAPQTALWRQGAPVTDVTLPLVHTIIATFDRQGRYANAVDGSSHAAVFISRHEAGIEVYDQWVGQPVHRRTIRFRGGQGYAVNDADRFYVVETDTAS